MSDDETQPVSGSRWEQPAGTPDARPTAQAATAPAYAPAPQPRNRSKLLLAGGAVGVALVACAGGFALGHATAGDDRDGPGHVRLMHDGGPQGTFPGQGDQGLPDDGAHQDAPNT